MPRLLQVKADEWVDTQTGEAHCVLPEHADVLGAANTPYDALEMDVCPEVVPFGERPTAWLREKREDRAGAYRQYYKYKKERKERSCKTRVRKGPRLDARMLAALEKLPPELRAKTLEMLKGSVK